MNNEVRQQLIDKWIVPEDVKYLDEAINNINEKRSKQYRRKYDVTNPQKTKRWEYVFPDESNDPANGDIEVSVDYVIARLHQLKNDGYPYIGYEEDEPVAYCYVPKTTSEWAWEIRVDVIREINSVKRKHNTREQKIEKLEKLKKQISALEKELQEEKENYRERYKRIGESENFKKHYEDKSLGECQNIE